MADECTQVLRAAEIAARWHADQKTKGASGSPYINHLLEVARLVAEATRARDPKLIIAALLHDSIEDQDVSRETIAELFGNDVASLVEEVTDDKSLPSKDRKRISILRSRQMPTFGRRPPERRRGPREKGRAVATIEFGSAPP